MEVEDDDIDGIIKSIIMKNFFCHDNFRIDFNKNVTYLVGCNGSGKSAVVTALTVGLGGKASATNRGTNLSSFIKKGADSASVEIKIKNSSPMAYKHEIYGDTITVIHDFSVSGSSTYKVKSHSGKLISTRRQDVQDIALAHNIQVDNPISVLNQDEARSFHSNEPGKKYAFFRKATNLDMTEKYYNEALDLCKKAEVKLEAKENAAKQLEEDLVKWDTLHKKMKSRKEIEQQKKELDNEYYWSEVVEKERMLEDARGKLQRRQEEIAQLQATRDRLASRGNCDLQAERELATALEARSAAERRAEAAGAAAAAGEDAARRREQAARDLRNQRALETRKLNDLRNEIQKMQSGDNAAARAELEARAAACKETCEAARARVTTAEHAAEQARQCAAHARDLDEEARERMPALRNATEEARRQLRALQRAGADSLAVFGEHMAELRRRVDAAASRGEFSQRPRGPVGAYIKLRDRQWGSALEHILGGSLTAFCTDNGQDARTLKNIISEVYGGQGRHDRREKPPSVSFSRFRARVHDVSGAAVRVPGRVSALDAVRVEDPVVANFLIDNYGLETVLLAPDEETAMVLTNGKRPVPANLRRVVTRDCSEFFPAPSYRSYGGQGKPPRYLHQDLADRIRQVQAEVESCGLAQREAERVAEAAAEERRRADEALRAEERALRALRADLAAREAQLANARAALRSHHAPTLQVLEEEVVVSEERLKKISAEEAKLEAGGGEGGAGGAAALREQLRAANEELRQARLHYTAVQERVQREQMELDKAHSEAQSLQQRLDRMLAEHESERAALEAQEAEVAAKRQSALRLCDPIPNPRSPSVVRQLALEAAARLREGLGTTLSRAAVGERLVQAENRCRDVRRAIKRNRKLINEIQQLTHQHLKKCCNMQVDIVRNVQLSFKCMLDRRDYTGSLKVDMSRGELSVECAPNGKRAGGTASLSGGERSYATVALLMALWQCVDLPFFFLDEFDVFMDNVNRKGVMKLLEEHALQRRGRQFVFLTPQDGTAIRESELISICKITK